MESDSFRCKRAAPAANWFIGVALPAEAGWIHAAQDLPEGVRRFHPLDLHITVAFLGPCGEAKAHRAWQAITSHVHPPVVAGAKAWHALGHPQRPSAFGLVLGSGFSALADLMQHWGRDALAAAERPAAQRVPLPHVTLARPSRRGGDAARTAMQRWITHAPVPTTPALLEHLALYTWAHPRHERLFQVVAQRRLDAVQLASVQLEAEV